MQVWYFSNIKGVCLSIYFYFRQSFNNIYSSLNINILIDLNMINYSKKIDFFKLINIVFMYKLS